MDWRMKLPSWDLPELEHVSEPNIGSVVATVTSGGGSLRRPSTGLDFDLKLGGLGDFGSSSGLKDQPRASTTPAVSPRGPSKRARTPSNGSQNVSCLVDGCKSDLSNCREYHRRHKVCELHSKTPIVLVGGQEQRFCQQCSRFHLLVEFDEVKRSCRKRLDGHNRRRRKPQTEPMNSGSLPLNLQGPRFSSYSHLYPTSTADHTWNSVVKNEGTLFRLHPPHLADSHLNFSNSYSCSYGEGKQRLPFQQGNRAMISSGTAEAAPVCQPLLNTISFSVNNGNGEKMFASGSSQVLDSDCALSLLSSPTQASSINQSHMVTFDGIPVAQTLADGLQQYGGLGRRSRPQSSNNVSTSSFSCPAMDDGQASTVLVSNDASDADLQCAGIFHVGDGSSSNGPSIVLPFSW